MLFIVCSFIISILLSFYIYLKLTCGVCRSKMCLVGKTILVTGGNSGVGYEVALDLAMRGCQVIIADKDNAEGAKHKIIAATGNPNIIVKHLDLSSLASIRRFVEDIYANFDRLDVLINNAGVGIMPKKRTSDGLDTLMQINLFGPFLLTFLLIDLLKKSAPSRIVFTSSCLAFAPFNLDLGAINDLTATTDYQVSKLGNIMLADQFAKRLNGSGVTSNSIHPGVVYTSIYQKSLPHLEIWRYILYTMVAYIFSKNVKQGAQTTIHAAISEEMNSVSGEYLWDCKPFYKPRLAVNEKLSKDLWTTCVQFVKLTEEEQLAVDRI